MVDEIVHAVDPQGDVVLVLRNPKAPFAVWESCDWASEPHPEEPPSHPSALEEPIDKPYPEPYPVPVSVEEPYPEPYPEPPADEPIGFGSVEGSQPFQKTQSDEEPEIKFLLSSRHLILASRYFNTKLNGTWKEATPHAIDRRYHLEASDWDAGALLILMNVIHGRTRNVPRRIDCEMLAKIAVLVDYYDCHEVIEVFASMWIDTLKGQLPSECSRKLVLWLLIAHVFHQDDIFANTTKTAVLKGRGPMPTMGLPIPPIVVDLINWRRQDAVGFILDTLNEVSVSLRSGTEACSHACSCMQLGVLEIAMYKHNLVGLNEPYLGFSIIGMERTLRNLYTPNWWSEAKSRSRHPCTLSETIERRLTSEFARNKEGFTLTEIAMSDVSRREGKDKNDDDAVN